MGVKTTKRTTPKKLRSIGQRLDEKKTIDELMEECKGSLHKIDKKMVSMQKGLDNAGTVGSTMTPSDEQLAKINEFTKITATTDNVVAFPTNAMNDLMDRDDEGFTTETVKQFASLPQPFSPIGKSYMVDHEYKMENAKGRIFDVSTKKIDGALHLTPEVYIPKTAQFADFIEGIDFGINNFVSVGVVIDKQECTICKEPVYTSMFGGWSWCAAGHEKGLYYVPGKEEEDSWGWYLPVDPETKGAVKAQVHLSDAVDFYELSQVFLGAQYYAELAKTPGFKGILKAASATKVPILGLSHNDKLPGDMPHEPDQLIEARKSFKVETSKDGTARWTDKSNLVWTYDPDENEVKCLGKAAAPTDDQRKFDVEAKFAKLQEKRAEVEESLQTFQPEDDLDDDEDPVKVAEALDAVIDEVAEAIDNGEFDQADDLVTAAEVTVDELVELLGGEDADDIDPADEGSVAASAKKRAKHKAADDEDEDEDEEEEEEDEPEVETEESKKILVAARAAKLPTDILTSWKDKSLKGLLSVVGKEIASSRKTIKELEPKAKIADEAIKDAEADAIHWYAVSRRDPKAPDKGTDVTLAQKLVARCEGDIALIKELGKEWQADARKNFGIKTVRSTVEDDPNERKGANNLPAEMSEGTSEASGAVVRRLHG